MEFKIQLIPDNYHLLHVGTLDVGALFWIDTQLNYDQGDTQDFVATYVFDAGGMLIWNEITNLGKRSDPNQIAPSKIISEQLKKLGNYKKAPIEVFPFSVEAYDLKFGLVVRKPEPEDNGEDYTPLVDAHPGLTIMFYPPWEDGSYDT